MTKNIEVEVRSFITKEIYDQLQRYFLDQATHLQKSEQETHYYDCKEDLRIQKNTGGSKIWLKKGKLHDDHREEIELQGTHEDFLTYQQLFVALGYEVEIKWFRTRNTFEWKGCKVMLDHTKGYGYIIEIEKMAKEEEKELVLKELQQHIKSLNIPLTPKEEFKKQFAHYKQHWRSLTK